MKASVSSYELLQSSDVKLTLFLQFSQTEIQTNFSYSLIVFLVESISFSHFESCYDTHKVIHT